MNKCYKKWWPAIWTIVISTIFIFAIFFGTKLYGMDYLDDTHRTTDKVERENLMNDPKTMGEVYRDHLNALFTKWDSILEEERKNLVTTLTTISTSLSIWVGLIAAICTILPVVLGINANLNFKNEMAHVEKVMHEKILEKVKEQEAKMKEKEVSFQEKVNSSETKLEEITHRQEDKIKTLKGEIEEFRERNRQSQLSQTLSDLAVHVRVISELEDFEYKDKGTLCKLELFPRVLQNVVTELCRTSQDIPDNRDENVFIGILLMLCMLKRLLVSTECVFTDYNLLTLQRLRAKIDYEVTKWMKVNNEQIDNKQVIAIAIDYTKSVRDLFNLLKDCQ